MAGASRDRLGIYISIPFCRSKCTYCNFASGVYPAGEHARYIDRVVADIRAAATWSDEIGVDIPRIVDSIYLGGGTPSLLDPGLIVRLFEAVQAEFEIEANAEITVECAPGQLPDAVLDALVLSGMNRVSLGVQSFIDNEARASGRLHTRSIVLDDVRRLRAAGLVNINLDLIAGLPGQTYASWEESLEVLVRTDVPHASVYMLEVDEDSRLGREMLVGGARYHAELVPSDEAITRMYEAATVTLAKIGLEQYEISNFARDGSCSRHNLRYWQRRPYLGLGLDASSALRAKDSEYVLRSTTTDDLKAYLSGPAPQETSWLSPVSQHEEAWFLGLRLNAGVNAADLRKEFGEQPVARALAAVERLRAAGLIHSEGQSVRLTAKGRLLSNEVFQEFLGVEGDGALVDEAMSR